MAYCNKVLQIIKNQSVVKIIYKLLHDALFLLLLFFVLALIAEGVLPGIISGHLKLFIPAIAILADIWLIYFLGKIIGAAPPKKSGKKTAGAVFLLLMLLIFNGTLNLDIFTSLFITVLSGLIAYFFAKIFFTDEVED